MTKYFWRSTYWGTIEFPCNNETSVSDFLALGVDKSHWPIDAKLRIQNWCTHRPNTNLDCEMSSTVKLV